MDDAVEQIDWYWIDDHSLEQYVGAFGWFDCYSEHAWDSPTAADTANLILALSFL